MDMSNCFNGMFGKLAHGMCRLTMNGKVAVKTTNSYKSYNVKSGKLTNCSNFVFDIGDDFFFVIPTNKVEVGDVILVQGKPRCVIEVGDKTITVMNYENSTIDTIVPERHVFMGNTYFYGKIMSLFGKNFTKGGDGMKSMMSYMMMSQMFGGKNMDTNGTMFGGNSILPMMMFMNGGIDNMFEGMFDGMFNFDSSSDEEDDVEEDDE